MRLYRIEYLDWCGGWYAAGAGPGYGGGGIWAATAQEAEREAEKLFGSLGRSYRAEEAAQ